MILFRFVVRAPAPRLAARCNSVATTRTRREKGRCTSILDHALLLFRALELFHWCLVYVIKRDILLELQRISLACSFFQRVTGIVTLSGDVVLFSVSSVPRRDTIAPATLRVGNSGLSNYARCKKVTSGSLAQHGNNST